MNQDYFKKNPITIIDQDGKIITTEKQGLEKNHCQVFARLEEENPGLLENYPLNIDESGGYDLACFCGATEKIVIWPSDINNDEIIIVTLPEVLSNIQCRNITDFIPLLETHEVYVNVSKFKKRNSPKVISKSISSSGNAEEAIDAINDYIDKCLLINDTGEELDEDIRNAKKHI